MTELSDRLLGENESWIKLHPLAYYNLSSFWTDTSNIHIPWEFMNYLETKENATKILMDIKEYHHTVQFWFLKYENNTFFPIFRYIKDDACRGPFFSAVNYEIRSNYLNEINNFEPYKKYSKFR